MPCSDKSMDPPPSPAREPPASDEKLPMSAVPSPVVLPRYGPERDPSRSLPASMSLDGCFVGIGAAVVVAAMVTHAKAGTEGHTLAALGPGGIRLVPWLVLQPSPHLPLPLPGFDAPRLARGHTTSTPGTLLRDPTHSPRALPLQPRREVPFSQSGLKG